MYYFYVLLSESDGKHYYGSTQNLRRRYTEHQDGEVTATKHRRPLRLVYYEAYESLKAARLREKQVKTGGSIRLALHKRITADGVGQPVRLADGRASSSAG